MCDTREYHGYALAGEPPTDDETVRVCRLTMSPWDLTMRVWYDAQLDSRRVRGCWWAGCWPEVLHLPRVPEGQ